MKLINLNNDIYQVIKILDIKNNFNEYEESLKMYYKCDHVLCDDHHIFLCNIIQDAIILKETLTKKHEILKLIDIYNSEKYDDFTQMNLQNKVKNIKKRFETPKFKIDSNSLKKILKEYLKG